MRSAEQKPIQGDSNEQDAKIQNRVAKEAASRPVITSADQPQSKSYEQQTKTDSGPQVEKAERGCPE